MLYSFSMDEHIILFLFEDMIKSSILLGFFSPHTRKSDVVNASSGDPSGLIQTKQIYNKGTLLFLAQRTFENKIAKYCRL